MLLNIFELSFLNNLNYSSESPNSKKAGAFVFLRIDYFCYHLDFKSSIYMKPKFK